MGTKRERNSGPTGGGRPEAGARPGAPRSANSRDSRTRDEKGPRRRGDRPAATESGSRSRQPGASEARDLKRRPGGKERRGGKGKPAATESSSRSRQPGASEARDLKRRRVASEGGGRRREAEAPQGRGRQAKRRSQEALDHWQRGLALLARRRFRAALEDFRACVRAGSRALGPWHRPFLYVALCLRRTRQLQEERSVLELAAMEAILEHERQKHAAEVVEFVMAEYEALLAEYPPVPARTAG